MESDASYGNSEVKLVWRFSSNLIYHVFSIKQPETNYTTSAYYGNNLILPVDFYCQGIHNKAL